MGATGPFAADALRGAVEQAYSDIARRPGDEHPFMVGRGLAEAAGYPRDALDRMPGLAVEDFAGVGRPRSTDDRYESCRQQTSQYAPEIFHCLILPAMCA